MTSSNEDLLEGVLVVEDDEREDYDSLHLPPAKPAAKRRHPIRALLLLVLLAGVVLAAYGLWTGDPRVAFLRTWATAAITWVSSFEFGSKAGGPSGPAAGDLLTGEARRIDLLITAVESGTLESASSVTVLSEVEGRVAVIELVPEGTVVEPGDIVVEFESSGLRTRRTEQQIVVERARASFSQAVQDSLVAESQGDSNVNSAVLSLEFSKLDLKKYEEGDYPLELRTLKTETALAEEALERARVKLQFTEELHRDGYLNVGELDADKFFETQARYRVDIAKERERLLADFSFPRMQRDLSSKVIEAEKSLERVKNLAAATVQQAKTNLAALESTLRLEENKLAFIEVQIEKCIMRAPQAGIVVYPVPEDEDLVELYIKQGAMVRERQQIFSIPDTDILQVSTNIHEALVNKIKKGMAARVWIDVYPDEELRGEVTFVSPLPLPEDWRKSTVKFYETFVRINAHGVNELRPGMSAKVEILMDQQLGVLAVPVQSVVQRGSTGYCYIMEAGKPVLREVLVGKTNNEYIAVLEGLAAGERIVLSPDVLGIPAGLLQERSATVWDTADAITVDTSASEEPADNILEIELEGVLLADAGDAMAQAEYESQFVEGELIEREFELTVQNCAPETKLPIWVGGVLVGEVLTDATGYGKVEFSMVDGTMVADFPIDTVAGTVVKVGDDLVGTIE